MSGEARRTALDEFTLLRGKRKDRTSAQDLADAIGAMLGNLKTERGWENLYSKEIAWEYFDHPGDPQACIDLEVKTGDRWFKLRHLNEIRIVEGLVEAFGSKPPTLVWATATSRGSGRGGKEGQRSTSTSMAMPQAVSRT